MDKIVLESLNKIRSLESKEVLTEAPTAAVAAPAAKAAGSLGARAIPGVGLALGAYDAYDRIKKGDYTGAALSGAAGLAGLVPGVGTAASLGLTGAQLARDYNKKTGAFAPDEEPQQTAQSVQPAAPAQVQVPPGGDPKVFALQQQLIAQGAKIKADGKMGPQTQTAMKQFPNVKIAENIKETKMSESQRISELMSRLAQIESQPQQVNEFGKAIVDFGKGAWAGMKNLKSPQVVGKTTTGSKKAGTQVTKVTNKPMNTGAKFGSTVTSRPAALAAGGALAYGASQALKPGEPATPADPSMSATPTPAAPAKPTQAAPAKPTQAASPASLSSQEEQELALLSAELEKEMGRVPELDALLLRHKKLRPGETFPN